MANKRLYLDYNATSPVYPEVLETITPYFSEVYQNPSSGYRSAKKLRTRIDTSRTQLAELLGISVEQIIYCSGGTEANTTVLQSLAKSRPSGSIITSQIEHSAVLKPLAHLQESGRTVQHIQTLPDGRLDLDHFKELLSEDIAFVSVMWVNNETGVIQPIEEIASACRERGIPLHVDACQAFGKLEIDLSQVPADFVTFSAHKFGGLKGAGGIIRALGSVISPLLLGGGQEEGYRSGTENVPAILSVSQALALSNEKLEAQDLAGVRDHFEAQVLAKIKGVSINGANAPRVGNTSSLSIEGCEGDALLILLDHHGIEVATGSACMTGKQQPSHVLTAMGVEKTLAKSSLRISFGADHTVEDSKYAAEVLAKVVDKVRSVQSVATGPVVVYRPK